MSFAANLHERLNPMLVKEVRQAIRGRTFRSSFLMILVIAAIISATALTRIDPDNEFSLSRSGPNFFFPLFLLFMFCCLVVVPVQANRTMAAERDEKTFDALIISGLRPSQIVSGKWLSAAVTKLLFLTSLLPFFATASTLYGLDLLMAFTVILLAFFGGLVLSLLGIMMACLANNRTMAALLQMLFLAACGLSLMGLGSFAGSLFFGFGAGFSSTGEFVTVIGLILAAASFALLWLHGVAVAAISHPEENGMLRVRVSTIAITLFLACVPFVLLTLPIADPARTVIMMQFLAIPIVGALNVPVLTESTRMRVRCKHQILQGGYRKPLSWLLLPGGGTAFGLLLLQLFILMLPLLTIFRNPLPLTGGVSNHVEMMFQSGMAGLLTMLGLVLACAGIPGYLASRPRAKSWLRTTMRFTIPILPMLFVLLLGIVSLLFGMDERLLNSPLNPFEAIDDNIPDMRDPGGMVLWLFFGGLSALPLLTTLIGQRRELKRLRSTAGKQSEAKD